MLVFLFSDLPGGLQREEWELLKAWGVCVSIKQCV